MRLYSRLLKLIAPLVYLASPVFAFADTNVNPCPDNNPTFKGLCDITNNFGRSISNLVVAAMVLASLVSLGFLIYGGVKWIMSEGDKTAVENARQTIIGAVIGLVIIFLSYFILSIILGVFGIKLNQLVIPTIIQ